MGKPHVSFIWHPWSLQTFDSDMKMLELTFAHARRIGLIPGAFRDVYAQMAG